MKKFGGLHRRWLLNTVAVVSTLGLVCVLAVTAFFATYYYSNMQENLRQRAEDAAEFFAEYLNQDYDAYYQSCITYAQTFEDRNVIELQFINSQGRIVASSDSQLSGQSPTTPEIERAVRTRGIELFLGSDPVTGKRIMAVSAPMIYSSGEVIGVLRYVTSTKLVDRQILFGDIYGTVDDLFALPDQLLAKYR